MIGCRRAHCARRHPIIDHLPKPMSRITVALPHSPLPSFSSTLRQFIESPLVVKVFVLHAGDYQSGDPKCEGIQTDALTSGKTLNGLFKYLRTEFLLFVSQSHELQLG